MHSTVTPSGDVWVAEWDLTVPSHLVRQIKNQDIGRGTLSEELEISAYKAEKIISWIRSERTSSAPFPTAEVEGVVPEDYDPDLEDLLESAEKQFNKAEKLATRKKSQKITFRGGPIGLVWFGDTHFGSGGTDVKRAFAEAELVRDTPGLYAVFNGDLVDNFVVGRLALINMHKSTKIADQWALGRYWIERFGRKLIAVNGGNHDKWSQKVAGIEPIRNLPHPKALYDSDEIAVDLIVEDYVVPTMIRHQYKGYSYWNPFHSHTRAAKHERPGYRLYVGAHTHTHGGASIIPHGGELIHAIQCGTYKYHDDFGREKGFSETGPSTAVATIIHPDGWISHYTNLEAAADYMRAIYGSAVGAISS